MQKPEVLVGCGAVGFPGLDVRRDHSFGRLHGERATDHGRPVFGTGWLLGLQVSAGEGYLFGGWKNDRLVGKFEQVCYSILGD